MPGISARLRSRARDARRETSVLLSLARDPRTPWYAKALAVAVVAYALSPIDLIPDFIPVLGYLDDLIIIPAGLLLVRRLVPNDLLAEHRQIVADKPPAAGRGAWVGAVIVLVTWLVTATVLGLVAWRLVQR